MNKLSWPHLWDYLGMQKDNGGRWYPSTRTPDWVREYLDNYRSPSRTWPNSYASALLTVKFAKLLAEKDTELAKRVGLT